MKLTMPRLAVGCAILALPIAKGQEINPQAAVQWSFREIEHAPPVTYKTNGNMVLCTAHCRDLNERNAVFDAFRTLPNAGVSGTKTPPEVCVVLPLDPTAFQRKVQMSRQQAMVQKAVAEQQARQRQAMDEAQRTLARRIDTEPEKLYGQQFTVEGEYEGLEPLPGDRPYEVGFSISERGKDHLSCVAFATQIVGDPITLGIPISIASAVRSLHVNDRVRITGKLVSPSMTEEPHLRRAHPFFVALAIERL
jgi:hypothetical protein